jgi:hypothetical protein
LPSLLGGDAKAEVPSSAAGERREPALDEPKAPMPKAASGLAREDLRKLQAALHELGECRQLLDAVVS